MSRELTAEQLAQLRGQSVEGSFYLAECGYCGEMYPSNKLDGGEPLFSGDYGECYCPLCGADDSDIADNGAWGSEAVTAWNYQQKRVEALLDELDRKDKQIAELTFVCESADKVQREYAEALGCAGDNESILVAIDEINARTVTVPGSEIGEASEFGGGAIVVPLSVVRDALAAAGINLTVEG